MRLNLVTSHVFVNLIIIIITSVGLKTLAFVDDVRSWRSVTCFTIMIGICSLAQATARSPWRWSQAAFWLRDRRPRQKHFCCARSIHTDISVQGRAALLRDLPPQITL